MKKIKMVRFFTNWIDFGGYILYVWDKKTVSNGGSTKRNERSGLRCIEEIYY